jgi:uncharacterized protein YdhG (YjbR/CyaY superfamily)
LTPAGSGTKLGRVTAADVDDYLGSVDEPKRSTLEAVRRTIREIVPNAQECISYGMPAYRVEGKVVAGFAAFTRHLSYLPHSGSVFPELADDLAGYQYSSGSLRFAVDTPLPRPLIEKLIAVRMRQLGMG